MQINTYLRQPGLVFTEFIEEHLRLKAIWLIGRKFRTTYHLSVEIGRGN
jgi:hypothetical protein